jgi:predicted Zn-ribbon and HTH transcriptional regulator
MVLKISHNEYVARLKEINKNIIIIGKYNGYHNSVQHKCECGNEDWYPQPANVLNGRKCKKCATERIAKNQTKKHDDYIIELHNLNPNICVLETYINAKTKIRHQCECGNSDWYTSPSNVLKGRKCKICGIKKFAKKLKRTDKEFKKEIYNLVGNEYTPLCKYNLVTEYIKMRHNICGYEWDITPISFLIGTRCPRCANERSESIIAITLKQVLKYYYPNTIWEYDIGFKGINGGYSRYDIYVPELNLLIECQSEYHDNIKQQKHDLLKKNYAIKNKYNYMALDKRNYNQLEAIQLFFPEINKIPKWVDVSIRHTRSTWDVAKAQELLEKGFTTPEIGEILNVSYAILHSAITRKSLIRPINYKIKQIKQRKKVVQLDLKGKFLMEHDGITLIDGFTATNISACCRGKNKSYKGYRWMYAVEYYDNIKNIKPYKDTVKQSPRQIVQLSKDGELIATFEKMTIEGFNKSGIWRCCNKKTKTYKGFKWMYLEEYLIIKEERKENMSFKDLSNLTFVVTGSVETFKNRKELEALISSLNGKLSSAVSSKTNYLINNDVESTSGKNKKAKDLNVLIISEAQFNEMIGR